MNTYYKAVITYTQKPAGRYNGDYTTTGEEVLKYKTIAEMKEDLKYRFGNCKTSAIYRDRKDRKPYKVGKLYHHKAREYQGDKTILWQDWVECREVKEKTILI